MIQLVGPGGAGKTTVGRALATRLGIAFVDLDERFTVRAGDISAYLGVHGYQAYAARNIQVYLDTLESLTEDAVIALSSGFMTYRDDAHPACRRLHREIAASASTAVLLPSFDYEACVTETVRRQLRRPFSRSAEREEQVIRARFGAYWGLPAKKFETKGPVDAVVDDLAAWLRAESTACGGHRLWQNPGERDMTDEVLRVALRELLEELEAVGAAHEELYDTDVREQMFEAVLRSFLKPEPGYALPSEFGMFDQDANAAVRKALAGYISKATARAAGIGMQAPAARLAAFQDAGVKTRGEEQSPDNFFGWAESI